MKSENSQRFPLRSAPEVADRFPYRDLSLYTLNSNETKEQPPPVEQQQQQMSRKEMLAVRSITLASDYRRGSIAQQSLEHLRASGREIDLNYVPWFRPVWNKVQRFWTVVDICKYLSFLTMVGAKRWVVKYEKWMFILERKKNRLKSSSHERKKKVSQWNSSGFHVMSFSRELLRLLRVTTRR